MSLEKVNQVKDLPNYGDFNGLTMPLTFKNFQEQIKNFEVFDDDVWLCSYPKSGT